MGNVCLASYVALTCATRNIFANLSKKLFTVLNEELKYIIFLYLGVIKRRHQPSVSWSIIIIVTHQSYIKSAWYIVLRGSISWRIMNKFGRECFSMKNVYFINLSIFVTTEICLVYTITDDFRQIFCFQYEIALPKTNWSARHLSIYWDHENPYVLKYWQ